jgi:hypothetical protein
MPNKAASGNQQLNKNNMKKAFYTFPSLMLVIATLFCAGSCNNGKAQESIIENVKKETIQAIPPQEKKVATIDTIDYNKRMLALSNRDTTGKWPVKTPYPLPGAILPYNRIVAYYGNLYSKKMGILGALPKDEMLQKLQSEVATWQAADTTTNVIPALHYIAVTAQILPGKAKLYRMRMPFQQIDTIINWAKSIDAFVFLDVQVGHSNIRDEVTQLVPYLKLPNVHLGIDPEYSLKNGEIPGSKIGTFNSQDINDAIEILANLVQKNNLSPKVLVVHRFTRGMVTDYENIKIVPEVQVVMDMDGFGEKVLKKSAYHNYIYGEPVQFTGFKLFYKNDTINNGRLFRPEELLKFTPKPVYIQYQ